MNKSANEYRNEQARHIQEEHDSFERCDTDGFISQHCSSLNGRLAGVRADIIENDGKSIFVGLYQGDRRVVAKIIETKFGSAWLLDDSEAEIINSRGKKFLPTGSKSRVLSALGLKERKELAPAWACHSGEGRGFSGLSSVRISVYRTGDKWGSDSVLVEAA